jgi:hypothetical protein
MFVFWDKKKSYTTTLPAAASVLCALIPFDFFF